MAFTPIPFGKYTLIQPLAQGGMAEIFLAKQQGPAGYEKTVVIKRVLSHFSQHPEFTAMFLDEARLAAQLSHPNVVQIFDFGEQDGSYYLCMEYLRGEDLSAMAKAAKKKNEQIPAQVAATLIAHAADGLHYAHTLEGEDGRPLKIVHRDISPSNLFLTFQGQVKVLDFGIARAEGKVVKTTAGQVKGKLSYMAPEQAKGKELDARADVWALGTVLWELLAGKRLFWRSNEAEVFQAMLKDPIPLPSELSSGVPAELDDICAKALERDLDKRYPSAKAMQEELDDYLASRTYVPPKTLLQQYVTTLVGEDAVARRMKATGSMSAFAQPLATPASNPGATKASGARKALSKSQPAAAAAPSEPQPAEPAPRSDTPRSQPRPAAPSQGIKPVVLIPAAVGLVLIAVGITWAVSKKDDGPKPPAPVNIGRVEAVPDPDPAPAPAPAAPDRPAPAPGPSAAQIAAKGKTDAPEPAPAPVAPTPAPPRATKGTLDVNCVPWCQIFVDGKDTGRTSPAIGISLSAGRHQLRVVNPPTGISNEKPIVIEGGKTTREVIKF